MGDETLQNMNPEDLASAIDNAQSHVDLGMAMKRLQENPDFKLVFESKFMDNWSGTQIRNCSVYDAEQRKGVLEQMVARSIHFQFIQEILEYGRAAKDVITELQEDEKSAQE